MIRKDDVSSFAALAGGLLLWTAAVCAQVPKQARPAAPLDEELGFDRPQSAALFVGIREFSKEERLVPVEFAVDDAVDLAYLFTFDLELVTPGRVALALSGEPQKEASRKRLVALTAAGAAVHAAAESDVYHLLDKQSRSAGAKGLLLLAVATHGFNDAGTHRLATADSLLNFMGETTVTAGKILDTVFQSPAGRRLVFIDACRENLTKTERGTRPLVLSTRPGYDVRGAAGDAVFLAARQNGYAYDDFDRRNGVFTASILRGLGECEALADVRGMVTVESLGRYLEGEVQRWIAENRSNVQPGAGTETSLGGAIRDLPLARCDPPPEGGPTPSGGRRALPRVADTQPAAVRPDGEIFTVLNATGETLWGKRLAGGVTQAQVADLHGDGRNEVVVGIDGRDADGGKILAYGYDGELLWPTDTSARPIYDGGYSGRLVVTGFKIADLFGRGTQQVVAISKDSQGWYPSRLTILDTDGTIVASYWHPGHLHHVEVVSTAAGEPRILVAGVNNDLGALLGQEAYLGVVFMLDPSDVRGQAPPYSGADEPGPHLWYGFLMPARQGITRLEMVDRDEDGRQEISVWTASGHVLYLEMDGDWIETAGTDGVEGIVRYRLWPGT